MSQSSPTVLASGAISRSGDTISIELHQPDSMPAVVRIVWPTAPTIVDPKRFLDVAAAIAQLFARAHIVLAAIRAERRL